MVLRGGKQRKNAVAKGKICFDVREGGVNSLISGVNIEGIYTPPSPKHTKKGGNNHTSPSSSFYIHFNSYNFISSYFYLISLTLLKILINSPIQHAFREEFTCICNKITN